MEAVVLLQRQQLAEVEVPQPPGHRLHYVGAAAALPPAALLPQPAKHRSADSARPRSAPAAASRARSRPGGRAEPGRAG